MAAPAKKARDNRGEHLQFRLSADELATFAGRVQAAGLNRADYIRQAVLEGRVIVKRTAQADPALIAQLIRLGTNVNQIAKTANATGRVPDNLDQLCKTIEDAIMRAIDQEA